MKLEDAARGLAPPGHLSRYEKDALWERIDGQRRAWYRRPSVRVAAAGAMAAVGVAALLLVLGGPRTENAELTARGDDAMTLVIRCADRTPGECRTGDRMTFDVGSEPPPGYLALLARGDTGNVIWYLPSDEGAPSADLVASAKDGVLDRVAVIDTSYTPGTYTLFAVVSEQPLTRATIRGFAAGDDLVAPPGVRIEKRTFVVQEDAR